MSCLESRVLAPRGADPRRSSTTDSKDCSMAEIWHNPRCSKSHQALKLLEERGCDFHVRRYFDELLSREELAA